jgi:[ribosomal protein S5]-alanine N-acetyltransferase
MAFSFFQKQEAPLFGSTIYLRPPLASDYTAWAKLRSDSRHFLEPWEPTWAADELDKSGYRDRMTRYKKDRHDGVGLAYFVFLAGDSTLVGGINLHIKRGVAQSGHIGYWMGERFAGRGYMSEAVDVIKHHAFSSLGLHRLEAACIPDNERSVRLLKKAGFTLEGHIRSYLKINGRWRDHLLFSFVEGDEGPA